MKKLKMMLVLVLLCGTTLAFKAVEKAPVARIGFTNPNVIMQSMEGMAEARAAVDTLAKQLQGELQLKLEAFQQKAATLQAEEGQLNELVLKDRQQELAGLEQSIKTFREKAAGAVQAKERELLSPYVEKLNTAIKEVAEEKGYTHVFNTTAASASLVLYAQEFDELDSLIINKLASPNNE